MLSSSVFATRPSRPSLPPSIPFLPSSHSGLSFSMSCTLLSATATSQPFAYQSLRNSFHRHGGCTPSRTHSARTLIPVIQPFYFHTITNCKFNNSFLLMVFHVMGVYPPAQNLGRHIPHSLPPIPFFSYPCALFCTHQNHNSFVFKRFRTLCANTRGWGRGADSFPREIIGYPKETGGGRWGPEPGVHRSPR